MTDTDPGHVVAGTPDPPMPRLRVPPKPEIHQFVTLSTAHLPEHLGEHPGDRGAPGLNSAEHVVAEQVEHGWWLWVPDDPTETMCPNGFDCMELDTFVAWKVATWARGLGCDWVRFDRDGDKVDDLETWEW